MYTLNVGYVVAEDSDVEEVAARMNSSNIFIGGQNRFKQYRESLKTTAMSLSVRRRYEENGDVRETLLFLLD